MFIVFILFYCIRGCGTFGIIRNTPDDIRICILLYYTNRVVPYHFIFTTLYCISPYCIVFYRILLYYALYYILLFHIALYFLFSLLYCFTSLCIALYYTRLNTCAISSVFLDDSIKPIKKINIYIYITVFCLSILYCIGLHCILPFCIVSGSLNLAYNCIFS